MLSAGEDVFNFTCLENAQAEFDMRLEVIDLIGRTRRRALNHIPYGLFTPDPEKGEVRWSLTAEDDWKAQKKPEYFLVPYFQQKEQKNYYRAATVLERSIMKADCSCATDAVYLIAAAKTIGQRNFDALHKGELLKLGMWVLDNPALKHHLVPTRLYESSTKKSDPAIRKYNADKANWIPGDCAYFTNKPNYVRLAPLGFWRGENTVYVGGGLFSGLELYDKTYGEIQTELINQYKEARTLAKKDEKDPKYQISNDDVYLETLLRPKTGLDK
jgi:hypothetical protein